jgi:hypothetical protein
MFPKPLSVWIDYSIQKLEPGKKLEKIKFEDISEKEYLLRLVSLGQSIRSMLMFFVIIVVIEIIAGVVIAVKLIE